MKTKTLLYSQNTDDVNTCRNPNCYHTVMTDTWYTLKKHISNKKSKDFHKIIPKHLFTIKNFVMLMLLFQIAKSFERVHIRTRKCINGLQISLFSPHTTSPNCSDKR